MRRKVFIKGLLFCLLFTFFSSLNQRVYANEDLFKDVPDDHWAYSYIEFLTDQGIIKGYLDGTFKPNATITRLQVATMLTRALKIDTQYYSEPYYEDVTQTFIGNMDSLRVIDLSFTSLTDSEIKDLKTSYPYISFLY